MSEKKIPIESTRAEFWNVVAIPAPAPRRLAGRLFMMPAWLGDANRPIAEPDQEQQQRRTTGSRSSTGRSSSRKKLSAATSMPPVANGRAPKRSER